MPMARNIAPGLDGAAGEYKTTFDRVLVWRRRSNIRDGGFTMAQGRSCLVGVGRGRPYACWGEYSGPLLQTNRPSEEIRIGSRLLEVIG